MNINKYGEVVKHMLFTTAEMIKHILPIQIGDKKKGRKKERIEQFDILLSPDYGGYFQHTMSISSLLRSRVHWNLGCSDYLHESSCICWLLEVIFLFKTPANRHLTSPFRFTTWIESISHAPNGLRKLWFFPQNLNLSLLAF